MEQEVPIFITRFNNETRFRFLHQTPGHHEKKEHADIKYWLNSPKAISPHNIPSLNIFQNKAYVILMLNSTPYDRLHNDNKTDRVWGIVIIDTQRVRIGPASNRRVYLEDRRNMYGYPVNEFISLNHLYDDNVPEWVLPLEQHTLLNAINTLLFTGKTHQKRGYGITSAKCIHNTTYFRRFVEWAIVQHST